jgi:hypothetical protein
MRLDVMISGCANWSLKIIVWRTVGRQLAIFRKVHEPATKTNEQKSYSSCKHSIVHPNCNSQLGMEIGFGIFARLSFDREQRSAVSPGSIADFLKLATKGSAAISAFSVPAIK